MKPRGDFAVGLPVLNRANAQMRATAGLFVGVMPTRLAFGPDLRFVELIQGIGRTLKAHYRHQRFPVSEEVNRAVGLEAKRSNPRDWHPRSWPWPRGACLWTGRRDTATGR